MKPSALLRRLLTKRPALPDPAVPLEWLPVLRQACHNAPASSRQSFLGAGYRASDWFAHRFHCLPKCGPDGLRLAARMCDVWRPAQLWQIVLYASSPAIDEFPEALFFDPELLWHQQHFNRPGQVASVDLVAEGSTLHTMALQSDLVQRISRRRGLKTRVEKVFKGWDHLLLNAIAAFAAEHGFREIRVPRSGFAMRHADRARVVKPELFERVYDRAVKHHFRVRSKGSWWSINVRRNRRVIVRPPLLAEERGLGRTVCLCHDIERGLGHRGVEPAFAERADREAPAALEAMLAAEQTAQVRTTYNVVGCLLQEIRPQIERDGHCLGFHSYDHDLAAEQLVACRRVDYRIKGYRPPQSRLTPELRGDQLCWHNFEWLAAAASSLGFDKPRLENRLAKIPILLDDFALHRRAISFEAWARRLLDLIRQHDFVAVSLHDCYAAHWLPGYARLLDEIRMLAQLRTLDEVAAELYLAGGV